MQHTKLLISFLCVAASSMAFAADPPASSTSPAPAPAAQTESAAQPAPSAAPAPTADDIKKAQDAQSKRLRVLGYKPEVRRGVTVYCKSERPIGSNFPKETCGDGDAIEAQAKFMKAQQETQGRIMNQGSAVK